MQVTPKEHTASFFNNSTFLLSDDILMVLTAVIFNIFLIFPIFGLPVAVRQSLEFSKLHLLYVANSRTGSMEKKLATTTIPAKPV